MSETTQGMLRTAAPTATDVGQSPYHLTEEQVQFFDDHGYLILRQRIPQDLLLRLQAAGKAWIDQGLRATGGDPHAADFCFADRSHGRVMYRVNHVHDKGQSASLELLGSPYVLAIAESMCGPDFVPTYESMVFKDEGDGAAIPWHQDAVHQRRYRIFNLDVYLDHSRVGGGALRVIPGTQRQKQDICGLTDRHGWDAPDAIQVEMAPGDVLLHDVMVVHGSEHVQGNALRRTIYYEFRAAEEILEDGRWSREWMERRLRFIEIGLKRYQQAFPTHDQFRWNIANEFRPQGAVNEEEALRVDHLVNFSGAFCSAG